MRWQRACSNSARSDIGCSTWILFNMSCKMAPCLSHLPICQCASAGMMMLLTSNASINLANSSLQNSPALSDINCFGGPAQLNQKFCIWDDTSLHNPVSHVRVTWNWFLSLPCDRKWILSPGLMSMSPHARGVDKWLGRAILGVCCWTSLIPSMALLGQPWSRSTFPQTWASGCPRFWCMRASCLPLLGI